LGVAVGVTVGLDVGFGFFVGKGLCFVVGVGLCFGVGFGLCFGVGVAFTFELTLEIVVVFDAAGLETNTKVDTQKQSATNKEIIVLVCFFILMPPSVALLHLK
jgi:hypothetical protein